MPPRLKGDLSGLRLADRIVKRTWGGILLPVRDTFFSGIPGPGRARHELTLDCHTDSPKNMASHQR